MVSYQGELYLARAELPSLSSLTKEETQPSLERLLPAVAMRLPSAIMRANALALGEAVGLPRPAMLEALREFRGLPPLSFHDFSILNNQI